MRTSNSTAVNYVILPGGEHAYECSAPACGKTIHEDCVQGLAVRDELAIELPAPRVTTVEVA